MGSAPGAGRGDGRRRLPRHAAHCDAINAWDAPDVEDTKVFHAGTRMEGDHAVTAGGRVLCVCALGDTVADAQRKAYAELAGISWPGEFHRHDIGWRAIERERQGA
jgi:phosphoribosylamine---glycine ligase